jgi:NAD(P)-dependent dehydrogenase (short-subunit alcohol dehydrogenase family)
MGSGSVVVITGAGGMGAAIARRIGTGSSLVLADFNQTSLDREVALLTELGYDVRGISVDVSDAASVDSLVAAASELGDVRKLVHTAGLSPVQASAEAIFRVDLLGTALMLDRFGPAMAPGGAAVFIASMAGTMTAFDAALEHALAFTPTVELLEIPAVAEVTDPGIAYGLAKRANQVRMWAASLEWGARGARVNSISPGVISTPMGNAELEGASGDMMRFMIDGSATKRVGTPEDIAAAAAFLLSDETSFITGTDLLVDGGAVPYVRSVTPQ